MMQWKVIQQAVAAGEVTQISETKTGIRDK
jgi:hypothetical protein